jgi:hypothetical protein
MKYIELFLMNDKFVNIVLPYLIAKGCVNKNWLHKKKMLLNHNTCFNFSLVTIVQMLGKLKSMLVKTLVTICKRTSGAMLANSFNFINFVCQKLHWYKNELRKLNKNIHKKFKVENNS